MKTFQQVKVFEFVNHCYFQSSGIQACCCGYVQYGNFGRHVRKLENFVTTYKHYLLPESADGLIGSTYVNQEQFVSRVVFPPNEASLILNVAMKKSLDLKICILFYSGLLFICIYHKIIIFYYKIYIFILIVKLFHKPCVVQAENKNDIEFFKLSFMFDYRSP